jgi:hypothetical protein
MAKQQTLWDRYKMPLSVAGFFITAVFAYVVMTALQNQQEIRSKAASNGAPRTWEECKKVGPPGSPTFKECLLGKGTIETRVSTTPAPNITVAPPPIKTQTPTKTITQPPANTTVAPPPTPTPVTTKAYLITTPQPTTKTIPKPTTKTNQKSY